MRAHRMDGQSGLPSTPTRTHGILSVRPLCLLASCSSLVLRRAGPDQTTWSHLDALPSAGVHRVGFTSALGGCLDAKIFGKI